MSSRKELLNQAPSDSVGSRTRSRLPVLSASTEAAVPRRRSRQAKTGVDFGCGTPAPDEFVGFGGNRVSDGYDSGSGDDECDDFREFRR